MPGKFLFELRDASLWTQAPYLDAIHATKKALRPPPGVYATYGPEGMGQAMVIKVGMGQARDH